MVSYIMGRRKPLEWNDTRTASKIAILTWRRSSDEQDRRRGTEEALPIHTLHLEGVGCRLHQISNADSSVREPRHVAPTGYTVQGRRGKVHHIGADLAPALFTLDDIPDQGQ